MESNQQSPFCGRPIRFSHGFEKSNVGAWIVTSRDEILHYQSNYIDVYDIGNGKAQVQNHAITQGNNRFLDAFVIDRTYAYTAMLGAICGDVSGSVYEHNNIKYIPDKDNLIAERARFTDDSVMTLAVAKGIQHGLPSYGKRTDFTESEIDVITVAVQNALQKYGRRYPRAGYGSRFRNWIYMENPKPYHSWSNGSAMRASYAGWAAKTLEDAELFGEISAKVTHDHPYGINGAKAVAGSIFILRNGGTKADVATYVSKYYNIDFTLDEIRDDYRFDVSCQGSVPQAFEAFFEGDSFEEIIALAISIGGDSDTIAAIAGSVAEVIYPIPEKMRDAILNRLKYDFKTPLAQAIDFLEL
ncbi:MAG: ADP-ribosylglycohydrolase family protein [Ruminococcus sp.]|nr:ADP-ribosylglycohydrolase family protein [Ruminococcus sp.]